MPRRALVPFLLTWGVVVVLAIAAGRDRRELAFTLNVRPAHAVADIEPGGEACHWGLQAGAEFDVVEPLLGTHRRPGPRLAITVRELGSGRVLARGHVEAGARDNSLARGRVAPAVEEGRLIGVCFRNEGTGPVAFFGGPTEEAPGGTYHGIRAGRGDMRLVFYRSEPRSVLAAVPDIFRRAALFRPEPVGAWSFWLLLALVAGGVPLLLAGAMRAAVCEPAGGAPREDPGGPPREDPGGPPRT